MLAMPVHYRAENDGRYHHPDQLDEAIAKRLHGAGSLGKKVPKQDADDHSAQDLEI